MEAAGAVTGFAAGVADLGVCQVQAGVRGAIEVLDLVFVASGALPRADEVRARDLRRRDHRAVDGHASDQHGAPEDRAAEDERRFGPARAMRHGNLV